MSRPRRNRYRTSGLLLAAMGLLAAVGVFAGLAVAKDGNHRSEHRHHHDGAAGTIASFDADTGRLTIALLDGETVSGLVTRRTRIKCEDEHSPDVTRLRHGEEEPGDDRGGHGNEPNDDNGDHDDGDNSGPGSSGSGPGGHDDNGIGANCTASDLIPGAVVEEAELEIEHGAATFEEVELAD